MSREINSLDVIQELLNKAKDVKNIKKTVLPEVRHRCMDTMWDKSTVITMCVKKVPTTEKTQDWSGQKIVMLRVFAILSALFAMNLFHKNDNEQEQGILSWSNEASS